MQRLFNSAILIFLFSSVSAQTGYWQQKVDYTINVALNDKAHTLTGDLSLNYTNNSPDNLDFIWFHLWPNAYKDKKTALYKQISKEKDSKDKLKDATDNGYIDGLQFTSEGKALKTEPDPNYADVLKVYLPTALASGKTINIKTPFKVKIPSYYSRMGYKDKTFMISQWYPKPAVYDHYGWHPMPYQDQGEFYSEFGSFDVRITLPKEYVVGATGVLQNAAELSAMKMAGSKNVAAIAANDTFINKMIKYISPVTTATKTLIYKIDSVHDFAWFADKDYLINYSVATLPSGKKTDVFSYYYPESLGRWAKSDAYITSAVEHYGGLLGEYPYPVVQAVEGPRNATSGGMEYPTITMITSPDSKPSKLDGIIAHEVGHNWFYGILGSNEREHAWMDEGINTYYQFMYEAEKYKSNGVFEDSDIPDEIRQKSTDEFLSAIYGSLSGIPMPEAIDLTATDYPNHNEYAVIVYLKTSIWMYLLENALGKDGLNKAMKVYYEDWKFKHPYPEDMKASLEKASGKHLDGFFELLNKRGSLLE